MWLSINLAPQTASFLHSYAEVSAIVTQTTYNSANPYSLILGPDSAVNNSHVAVGNSYLSQMLENRHKLPKYCTYRVYPLGSEVHSLKKMRPDEVIKLTSVVKVHHWFRMSH